MGKFEDLTGRRFGRLTVLGQCGRNPSNKILWSCACDCGGQTKTTTQKLKSGASRSCGCYNRDRVREYFTTHGGRHTRLFSIWSSMKTRCYNPKSKSYRYYGEKGVSICPEWLHDFGAFQKWAIANGYQDDLTIDRINVDGDYCPENCRWATWHEQRMNQGRRKNAVQNLPEVRSTP